jgi:hypothetical protein
VHDLVGESGVLVTAAEIEAKKSGEEKEGKAA